ncbi:hypothetical protein ACG0Z5_10485 [Scandinavium sp. M-37]
MTIAEVSQWLGVAGGVVTLFSGIAVFIYTRWKYAQDRQFSSVNDEKRNDVFKKIGELQADLTL